MNYGCSTVDKQRNGMERPVTVIGSKATSSVPEGDGSKAKRYFCRGADGPEGHCDDRPMTIQCDYCIWKQTEIEKQNRYQHYYGWNKPID